MVTPVGAKKAPEKMPVSCVPHPRVLPRLTEALPAVSFVVSVLSSPFPGETLLTFCHPKRLGDGERGEGKHIKLQIGRSPSLPKSLVREIVLRRRSTCVFQ